MKYQVVLLRALFRMAVQTAGKPGQRAGSDWEAFARRLERQLQVTGGMPC
jgi:hypothetical protein